MRWLLLSSFLAVVVGAGCEKTVYNAHESHYCSSKADDDPYYECAKSSDLVCITTYRQTYPATADRPSFTQDMWLCRLACTPGARNDCAPDEICCPGTIYGQSYGKTHACVLPSFCANPPPKGDAGTSDTGSTDTRPADTGGGGDAAIQDGAGDAASGGDAPDAPVDAGDPDAADAPVNG